MTKGGQLDADGVRALFHELSDRLAAAGVSAQLFVVGGAAMALAYDRVRLTRDVDALFVPAPEVRRIAEEMSGPHGLEPDWLNDAAKDQPDWVRGLCAEWLKATPADATRRICHRALRNLK